MQTNSDPYVGPRPFEEADRQVFFGRDREASDLVSLITAHPIVLLYAQSGAGKTSLVKASLIPMLTNEEQFDVLPVMRVREQAGVSVAPEKIDSIYAFNAIASAAYCRPDRLTTQPDWEQLAHTPFSAFLEYRKKLSGERALYTPTVAIFDQFEELFTLYPERWDERQQFFEQIRDALAGDPLVRVLFSMREDFIAELDPYASVLPEKLRTRFRIEKLNRRSALVAVTQPLKAISSNNGVRFDDDAAEELIDNLLTVEVRTRDGVKRVPGKYVEALQLQVVCQSLWQSLKPGEQFITRKHLETFGDLNTALSAFYENAIRKTAQRTGIRSGSLRGWCEQRLITSAGTRAPVFRDEKETSGISNEAVDELERQSLLRMELRGGARWYELSHDRFVEVIKQSNQTWRLGLPGSKQIMLLLEERAAKWEETNREPQHLLNEIDFFETQDWLASPVGSELELTPLVDAFLGQSRAAIQARAQLQNERRQRLELQASNAASFKRLSYVLSVLALLALVTSAFAFWQWRKANQLKIDAESRKHVLEQEKKNREFAENVAGSLQQTVQQQKEHLSRSEKVMDAMTKLNTGDLEGARTVFNAILTGTEHSTLDKALAHAGLGQVAAKSGTTDKYRIAIRNYDEALKLLGYDPQGKWLPQTNIPSADEAKYDEKAAHYLVLKGDLYLDWAKSTSNPSDLPSRALERCKNARAFYKLAKDKGGPGAGFAEHKMREAQQEINKINEGRASSNTQQPSP